jgi:dienelactone hydrolase
MQRGNEAPILPATPAGLPVLLYSHGYAGSPLEGSYLNGVVALASWGYVVVAPFHGDLRYSAFGPDDVRKLARRKIHVPIWSEFVAMQATRPLSLSAGLDLLLARPEWRDRVDVNRVGAFGISQGGETLMLLGGAELTYDLFDFGRHKRVTLDARVRAAVGYIPYFGLDDVPAFGSGQAGAQGLGLPYFALSGTADPIAPADVVRTALERMGGPRGQVLLEGQGHDLDPSSAADIVTWTIGFLQAWVKDDAAAKSRLLTVDHVEGGLDDRKVLYVDPTASPIPGEIVETIEFYNAALDHYFITAFADEAAALDAGTPPGWTRTGYAFKSWRAGTGPGSDACRFFGTPGRGPNSHFYTISLAECDKVRANPDWTFEALAFRAVEPLASGCPAEYTTVTRLYNNGMGGQANHRYLTDPAAIEATVARGWSIEGPVFCVPR